MLAFDDGTAPCSANITAITDGVLAADIPHLEVLPVWQGRRIGSERVRRMLDRLRDLSMIDLMCHTELQPYYERFGFRRSQGMVIRNYDRQPGGPAT